MVNYYIDSMFSLLQDQESNLCNDLNSIRLYNGAADSYLSDILTDNFCNAIDPYLSSDFD
jgi:hypothetical protein